MTKKATPPKAKTKAKAKPKAQAKPKVQTKAKAKTKPKKESKPKKERPLTQLAIEFCHQMAVDGDRAQAYIRAGYKVKTERSAYRAACRLMEKPAVNRLIDELIEEKNKLTEITAAVLLDEVAKVAFSSLRDVIDSTTPTLTIRKVEDIPDRAWPAIKTIRVSETICDNAHGTSQTKNASVTMHPKGPAQKLLADSMGVVSDLDAAIATFRRYGYAVQRHSDGSYQMIDTYDVPDSKPEET